MSIGEKIKVFGIQKFGSVTSFAEKLGLKPQNLYTYFSKDIMPGAEFLMQLKKMGCDMNWLLDEDDNSMLVVKEPSIKYKINSLELENEDLKNELERLKNILLSISANIQVEVKPRKKHISSRWKKEL